MTWTGDIGASMVTSKSIFSAFSHFFSTFTRYAYNYNYTTGLLMDDFSTIRHEWKLAQLQDLMNS